MSYDVYFFRNRKGQTARETYASLTDENGAGTDDAELETRHIANALLALGIGLEEECEEDWAPDNLSGTIELNSQGLNGGSVHVSICASMVCISLPYWNFSSEVTEGSDDIGMESCRLCRAPASSAMTLNPTTLFRPQLSTR